MNSKDMEKRCNAMTALLADQTKLDALFQDATSAIDKVSKGDLSRDNIRTNTTTTNIVKLLQKIPSEK